MKRYRKHTSPKHLSRNKLAARLAQTSEKLETTQTRLHEVQRQETKQRLRSQALEDKVVELAKKVDAYYARVLLSPRVKMSVPDTQMQEQWHLSGSFGIGFQVDIHHLRLMPQACGRDAYMKGLADQFASRAYKTALEKLKLAVA